MAGLQPIEYNMSTGKGVVGRRRDGIPIYTHTGKMNRKQGEARSSAKLVANIKSAYLLELF